MQSKKRNQDKTLRPSKNENPRNLPLHAKYAYQGLTKPKEITKNKTERIHLRIPSLNSELLTISNSNPNCRQCQTNKAHKNICTIRSCFLHLLQTLVIMYPDVFVI